jgi:hypothetical protein
MKSLILFSSLVLNVAFASIPTEEGLLRNLNNPNIPGNQITIKSAISKSADPVKNESARTDYYKFVILLGDSIELLQVNYSGSQMLASQIQDVKYIPNLVQAIKNEKIGEKAMFYAALTMLATNKSIGMETFIEKSGGSVVSNKTLLNEDKMRLLRSYKSYLSSTKGKGEATSPLNPNDPKEKARVVELFKSNTFSKSKNIELVKEGNEFLWKVDWKSVKAYFTNEDKRLRAIDFSMNETNARLDASDYTLFNNNNEFPRLINIRDVSGEEYKIQVIGEEIKKVDRKAIVKEEAKPSNKLLSANDLFSFLF